MDKEFAESYNTAEWQKKKNRILERDNYTCQICGDTERIMQVHHITYAHCDGKACRAHDNELITLCANCHKGDDGDHIHFFNGLYEITISAEGPVVKKASSRAENEAGEKSFAEFDRLALILAGRDIYVKIVYSNNQENGFLTGPVVHCEIKKGKGEKRKVILIGRDYRSLGRLIYSINGVLARAAEAATRGKEIGKDDFMRWFGMM